MRHDRKNIVVTRPLDGPEIEYARILGLETDIRPALTFEFPEYWDRVLATITDHSRADWVFTSRNAVKALAAMMESGLQVPPQTQVFAVGRATGDALEELGISPLLPMKQDGTGLAERIVREGSRSVLWFRGSMSRRELPDILAENDIEVLETEVYTTNIQPVTLPKREVDAVLFYSPSAVEGFRQGEGFHDRLPPLFAIGDTTADALEEATGNPPAGVADQPDTRKLLQTVARHLFPEQNPHTRN